MTQLDWHWLTLSQACQRLKSGQGSALQLAEETLARANALSDQTQAFAMLLADDALSTAKELDEKRSIGEPLGLLHGVPIGIKDLLFTKGLPTASGTQVMANFRPDFDATVVTRLRQAGAVLIGKTQLTEGAFGSHHPSINAPVNPWNKELWSGVSSSGSAVAVAAGQAFAAIGSDTGGSIRFPSASCGLVGLKPTYGRVSLHGAFPLANSLDHIGPMTRSVEDAARMLCVLAGFDAQDPNSIDAPVPNYLQSLCSPDDGPTPLIGMRIGIDWSYVADGVAPEVVDVTKKALRQFAEFGAQIIEVEVPASARVLAEAWSISCAVECALAHQGYYPEHKALYGPVLQGLIELGLRTSAEDYQALEALRKVFTEQLNGVLAGVDALISPCMPLATPSVMTMESGAPVSEDQADFLLFTAPFDYSGHPTLTLPLASESGGLPGSFQLVGAKLGEAALLRLGSALEQASQPITYPELLS